MKCLFVELDAPDSAGKRRCKCARCGLRTNPTASPLSRIHAECRYSAVGDWLAWALVAIGITAARYLWAKRAVYKLAGWHEAAEKVGCGCQARRDILNELTFPWVRGLNVAVARARRGWERLTHFR
jgi:hypothetical protein